MESKKDDYPSSYPQLPVFLFCSFLIYRLEKYLVKRGFQVKYNLSVIFYETHILHFTSHLVCCKSHWSKWLFRYNDHITIIWYIIFFSSCRAFIAKAGTREVQVLHRQVRWPIENNLQYQWYKIKSWIYWYINATWFDPIQIQWSTATPTARQW